MYVVSGKDMKRAYVAYSTFGTVMYLKTEDGVLKGAFRDPTLATHTVLTIRPIEFDEEFDIVTDVSIEPAVKFFKKLNTKDNVSITYLENRQTYVFESPPLRYYGEVVLKDYAKYDPVREDINDHFDTSITVKTSELRNILSAITEKFAVLTILDNTLRVFGKEFQGRAGVEAVIEGTKHKGGNVQGIYSVEFLKYVVSMADGEVTINMNSKKAPFPCKIDFADGCFTVIAPIVEV